MLGAQPCSQTLILCPHVLGMWLLGIRYKYTHTTVMFPPWQVHASSHHCCVLDMFSVLPMVISAFRTLATNEHMLTCTCDHMSASCTVQEHMTLFILPYLFV